MYTKKELRKKFLDLRNSMSKEEIIQKSKKITEILLNMDFYKKSHVIMTYVDFGSEVITRDFIKYAQNNGKKVFVPLTDKKNKRLIFSELKDFDNDLVIGTYGILEPKKISDEDYILKIPEVVLVPGLIFSTAGYRIGYGGGYYDRYLKAIGNSPQRLGLAFDFQINDNIPTFDYDEKVDVIITEKRIIECSHE